MTPEVADELRAARNFVFAHEALYNQGEWGQKDAPACGTTCCLLGHHQYLFPETELIKYKNDVDFPFLCSSYADLDKVMKHFGIDGEDFTDLFSCAFVDDEGNEIPRHPDDCLNAEYCANQVNKVLAKYGYEPHEELPTPTQERLDEVIKETCEV